MSTQANILKCWKIESNKYFKKYIIVEDGLSQDKCLSIITFPLVLGMSK